MIIKPHENKANAEHASVGSSMPSLSADAVLKPDSAAKQPRPLPGREAGSGRSFDEQAPPQPDESAPSANASDASAASSPTEPHKIANGREIASNGGALLEEESVTGIPLATRSTDAAPPPQVEPADQPAASSDKISSTAPSSPLLSDTTSPQVSSGPPLAPTPSPVPAANPPSLDPRATTPLSRAALERSLGGSLGVLISLQLLPPPRRLPWPILAASTAALAGLGHVEKLDEAPPSQDGPKAALPSSTTAPSRNPPAVLFAWAAALTRRLLSRAWQRRVAAARAAVDGAGGGLDASTSSEERPSAAWGPPAPARRGWGRGRGSSRAEALLQAAGGFEPRSSRRKVAPRQISAPARFLASDSGSDSEGAGRGRGRGRGSGRPRGRGRGGGRWGPRPAVEAGEAGEKRAREAESAQERAEKRAREEEGSWRGGVDLPPAGVDSSRAEPFSVAPPAQPPAARGIGFNMPAALIQALAEARAEAWSWRQRALQLEAELVRGGAWAGVKELEEELRSLKTSWKAGQVRMAALEMERQELWKEATALRADRDRAHAVLRAASDLREAAEIPSPSPYALDLPPSRLSAAGPAWSVSQPWAASAEDLERGPAPKRSGGGALAALEDPALRLALARLLDGSGTVIGSPPLDEGPVLRPGSNPLPPAALQALAGHSLLNAAARGAAGAAGAAPLAAVPPRPSSGGLRLAPSALGRGPSPGAASAAQAPLRSALEVLLQAQGARAQGMDPSTLQALAAEMVALQNQRNA